MILPHFIILQPSIFLKAMLNIAFRKTELKTFYYNKIIVL